MLICAGLRLILDFLLGRCRSARRRELFLEAILDRSQEVVDRGDFTDVDRFAAAAVLGGDVIHGVLHAPIAGGSGRFAQIGEIRAGIVIRIAADIEKRQGVGPAARLIGVVFPSIEDRMAQQGGGRAVEIGLQRRGQRRPSRAAAAQCAASARPSGVSR